MWIVKVALQRPYTFLVLAILILLMGVLAILRTATDIFPAINIPVVAAIWGYTGDHRWCPGAHRPCAVGWLAWLARAG
jgi:multidrug efflux pump subunit AcrB